MSSDGICAKKQAKIQILAIDFFSLNTHFYIVVSFNIGRVLFLSAEWSRNLKKKIEISKSKFWLASYPGNSS